MSCPRATSIRLATAFAIAVLVCPVSVAAADEPLPYRPADTSSPRATLRTFIDSFNEMYEYIRENRYIDRVSPTYRPAARRILDCLDASELPEYARQDLAAETAVCLKEILDRVEIPPWEDIPDAEEIEQAGEADKLSRWRIPGTRITIARVDEGPQRHEFLFTPGTIGRVKEYYQEMRDMPYRTTGPAVSPNIHRWYFSAPGGPWVGAIVDRLPDWTRERKYGLTIWKWPAVLIALLISIVLMVAAFRLHSRLATKWRERSWLLRWLTLLFPMAAVLVPIGFKYIADYHLTVRGTPLYIISFVANLVAFLAALVVVFGVSNRIAETIIASPRIHPQGLDAQFIRILSKLLSLIAAVVILLEGGRYLGIPITTLLAGAGIGGLAVALAAQGTLKDLLGTMMILLDKPYRVGERIILKGYDGVVDEIGLRSTKIRLLTGHVASIPNDLMAESEIENVGRRQHIRRVSNLRIPLNTPREKVEQVIITIRRALENHEGMDLDFPPRVYFNEFNPDSFNIRVIYWYTPPNYWDFLAFSEQVNIAIMQAFEQHGIPFSLPLRISYATGETPSEQHVPAAIDAS